MYTKIIRITVAVVLLFMVAVVSAEATGPGTNNCWGTVVSQRASYYHDLGEHASSQDEPRVGVGNLAKLFDMSLGDLASLLGTLDDFTGDDPDGVTQCP
ncbi:hypothetical protein HY469_01235 [Candidatus Roizmanbacteria bacterium]|nr:hypothetical protein [Candidatus Roizmanbacteria bacterium]